MRTCWNRSRVAPPDIYNGKSFQYSSFTFSDQDNAMGVPVWAATREIIYKLMSVSIIYLDAFLSMEREWILCMKYTACDSSSSVPLLLLCRIRIHFRSGLTEKLAGLSARYKFIDIMISGINSELNLNILTKIKIRTFQKTIIATKNVLQPYNLEFL